MKELLGIGQPVHIGPSDEDGADGHIEAVFIYRNFVQYVVTRWEDGVKHVETVEPHEIETDITGCPWEPVTRVFTEDEE